jgi:tRNA modification GTPase
MKPQNFPRGETIAAIATAPGRGGVGIIRISGNAAGAIGRAITGLELVPRHAHFCPFHDAGGVELDRGIALFFPSPHSFTGEDVVELQAHGGPVILDLLLQASCQHGARPARPGEFSERAYLNDKIDLLQAEAIADLIDSTTTAAALNASRSLQGAFSRKIDELCSMVMQLRVYVEAAIDFPEEEIDFLQEGRVMERLEAIIDCLQAVMAEARQGSLMREGMKLVIAGRPNAGKSSLLNALSGRESAIVTPIEGTTRDVLREDIQIDGMPLHIVDTAGLRDSGDEIEREGIRRAWREMASADRILLVVDGSAAWEEPLEPGAIWPERNRHLSRNIPVTIVRNKCDLSGRAPGIDERGDSPVIDLSATTGAGLALLRTHLKTCVGYREGGEGLFSARRRHLLCLQQAGACLQAGREQLRLAGAGELLAEDLRRCHDHLGAITGAVSSDQLLGEIFSSFCIGK